MSMKMLIKSKVYWLILALLFVVVIHFAATPPPKPLTKEECHLKFYNAYKANPGMTLDEVVGWECNQ